MGKSRKSAKRLMLICNPQAGDPPDPIGRISRAQELLSAQGYKVILEVEKPKKRARKIAQQAVRQGYRLVVVLGGDGTIEAVMPALVGAKTRLGILGGGTENNIARNLGVPADLESACALIKNGQRRKIDIGRVKSKQKRMYFFEFAASGLLADIFPMAQALYKREWHALDEGVVEFIQYKIPRMKLTLNSGVKIEKEAPLVIVSNTATFGLEYLVAPHSCLDDGLLDVDFFPGFSKAGILAYFQSISRGRENIREIITRYQVRKIKIKATPEQDTVADGITLGKGTIKIRVLPGALRVITGEKDRESQDR
jgi:diacylglycerol kinase (ATP)